MCNNWENSAKWLILRKSARATSAGLRNGLRSARKPARWPTSARANHARAGAWPVAFDAGPSQTLLCSRVRFNHKPGKRLPLSPTCELKSTHRELKSDTHWWNWLCFQQAYIKASSRAFTVQMRYTHGVNKGNDRGETGRGRLVSALSPPLHTSHLQSVRRLEYRPHFVLTICQSRHQKASHRLLASLAESDYCWLLSHSVSAETRKPIYHIRLDDTSVQWMNILSL